jgi:hypothetical protein
MPQIKYELNLPHDEEHAHGGPTDMAVSNLNDTTSPKLPLDTSDISDDVSATSPSPTLQTKYELDLPNDEEHAHGGPTDMAVSNLDVTTSPKLPLDTNDISDETNTGEVSHNSQLSSPAPKELEILSDTTTPLIADCEYDNQSLGSGQHNTTISREPPFQSDGLETPEDHNEPKYSPSLPSRPVSTSTIFSESSPEPSVSVVSPILDTFPTVPGHLPSPNTPTRAHTISGYRMPLNRVSNSSIKSIPSLTLSSASSSSPTSPISSTINAPQPPKRTARSSLSLQRSKSQSRPISSVPHWYDDDSDDGEAGWATVVVTKRYY